VTLPRSSYQGKVTKKGLKNNYGHLIDFEPNFKSVLFQLAWFSWLFDVSLVPVSFLDMATLGVH